MNKYTLLAVITLASLCVASVVKRQSSSPSGYVLPDGAELILGNIVAGFSCEGKIYGYYADLGNDCRIFHVCVPAVLANGAQRMTMYSFFCGNQTVFDQANLVCAHRDAATPCDQAESLYNVNENFGKTDRPIQPAS